MKKKIIIIAVVAIVVLGGAFLLWNFLFKDTAGSGENGETAAPVSSVANITGIGAGISAQTRFSGLVEPQKTLDVKKDADKKVIQLFVAEGDMVKAGDKLFQYDTDDIGLKLDQAKLELESTGNKITTLKTQIDDLSRERDKAADSEKLNYTLQIQSLQLDVRGEEYKQTTQTTEIGKIEKSLTNAVVSSEIDGVVKSVNSTGQTGNDGQEKPYVSILSTGNYRIKCTATEFHVNMLSPGQAMVVRSRVDDQASWKGRVDTIDRENTVQNNNNGMGGMIGASGEGGNTASKYNFYILLDSFDGLILGQHIFAEMDYGLAEKKEGLWLPAHFIVSEEGKSFVWTRNDRKKLEKRQVTLGEHDAESDTYELKAGLTLSDYIAFPQDTFTNGMDTTEETMMNGGMGSVGGIGGEGEQGGVAPEGETFDLDGEATPETQPDDGVTFKRDIVIDESIPRNSITAPAGGSTNAEVKVVV